MAVWDWQFERSSLELTVWRVAALHASMHGAALNLPDKAGDVQDPNWEKNCMFVVFNDRLYYSDYFLILLLLFFLLCFLLLCIVPCLKC